MRRSVISRLREECSVFCRPNYSEGGVVFGAAFDKDFTVEHTYTETLKA